MSEKKNSTLSLAELEDKPGKVYILGVALNSSNEVRKWYLRERTSEIINSYFEHTKIIILMGDIDGTLSVGEIEMKEIKMELSK